MADGIGMDLVAALSLFQGVMRTLESPPWQIGNQKSSTEGRWPPRGSPIPEAKEDAKDTIVNN
jgi:hypothetical protein